MAFQKSPPNFNGEASWGWGVFMNKQEELFKREGMERAAKKHNRELEIAQETARLLGQDGRPVSMNEVREDLPGMVFGNWAGSIFKGREWEPVGVVYSRHDGGHCRLIRSWRLKKFAFESRKTA